MNTFIFLFFFFCNRQPPWQSIPFSHASVSFPYSPKDYQGEDSCGSDDACGVGGGRRGGGGRGGFHSDTKAMKRLVQQTVQWVPVQVCECVRVCMDLKSGSSWRHSGTIHDLLHGPKWPSLLNQGWFVGLRSLHLLHPNPQCYIVKRKWTKANNK